MFVVFRFYRPKTLMERLCSRKKTYCRIALIINDFIYTQDGKQIIKYKNTNACEDFDDYLIVLRPVTKAILIKYIEAFVNKKFPSRRAMPEIIFRAFQYLDIELVPKLDFWMAGATPDVLIKSEFLEKIS